VTPLHASPSRNETRAVSSARVFFVRNPCAWLAQPLHLQDSVTQNGMSWTMKNALCMALLASACLLTAGNAGASPFPLYDNFAGPGVDSSKWYGGESDYLTLDAVREVTTGHRLHLAATAYSSPNDDGYYAGGTYGLYFIHPEGITAVSYNVQVDQATA